MTDPISRISGRRSGIDAIWALRELDRVEREDPRPDDDEAERRRRGRSPRPDPPLARVDDGLPHVDVQA